MYLVSWNVAGPTDARRARLSAQAEAIAGEGPDLVALQEVTRETPEPWRDRVGGDGTRLLRRHRRSAYRGARRYANLSRRAGRCRLSRRGRHPVSGEDPVGAVDGTGGGVEVHVFHAPTGVGSGWARWTRWRRCSGRLSEPPSRRAAEPDRVRRLQRPQAEPPGGPLVTFAQDGGRAAARARAAMVCRGARSSRAADPVGRQALGPGRTPECYRQAARARRRIPRRCIPRTPTKRRGCGAARNRRCPVASTTSSRREELRPWSVRYRHDWRERNASGDRLSDHSGIVATFGAE